MFRPRDGRGAGPNAFRPAVGAPDAVEPSVRDKTRAAKQAALSLQSSPAALRDRALDRIGAQIQEARAKILRANQEDLDAARDDVAKGSLTQASLDRLSLQGAKFDAALAMVRAVAGLPDPLGVTLRATQLDEGLQLYQVTVPIGVVGCAFESRPDVGIQIPSLTIKSGNAVLLKGGHEASRTLRAIGEAIRTALVDVGMDPGAAAFLQERSELRELLEMDDLVDLVIPRGSAAFVRHVKSSTRIPVLGHAEGVCHTYVHASADLDAALRVCLDAKTNYPAACNATECILVDESIAAKFLPALDRAMRREKVELRGDEAARRIVTSLKEARDGDWGTEFADRICAVRVVAGLDEAIEFVNRHGSRHTDAILTKDESAAKKFVSRVDTANAYVNASTRFSDGYRYGLGAEVGVNTGKLHARGPMGLDGLVTTKWILEGRGHVVGDYTGPTARPFQHKRLEARWLG